MIHHNADPRFTLQKLALALKPSGLLELMVYNRYHRVITSAFQRAVRILNSTSRSSNYDSDLQVAKALLTLCGDESWIARALGGIQGQPEAALADALINPLEHSYTVQSLAAMVEECGLRLVAPHLNAIDRGRGTYLWDLTLRDPELQCQYERLSDQQRWLVTNLVLFEKSPMLWFFLQPSGSPISLPSIAEACAGFLDTTFRRAETLQRNLVLSRDGHYYLAPKPLKLPSRTPHESVEPVLRLVDERRTMREIFAQLGLRMNLSSTNRVRLHLTTTLFPYLVPV